MQHKFTPQTRMSRLIDEDASLLSTISRFGISFGFGNKTIAEACELNHIDTPTFLSVVNFIAEGDMPSEEVSHNISIETLIGYLKNGHSYFLAFKLPSLRNKLLEAVGNPTDSISYSEVFLRFFDEYVNEVRKHMEYEDRTVFPYVFSLLKGELKSDYRISVFEAHHTDVDSKLAELKNILIKYYPSKGNNYQLNEVISDLLLCEKDLATHNRIEDYFFVPVIESVEQKLIRKNG